MTETIDAKDFQKRLQRLDDLLRAVARQPDPTIQARLQEITQALLDLHGAGLSRMLGHLESAGEAGAAAIDAFARDEVVSGLLLLHNLHPLDVEARVVRAIESVRPALKAHGGDVTLVAIDDDGVVHLRLEGSCHGCPSSAVTTRRTIEEAIVAMAPEVAGIKVDEPAPSPADGRLVVLQMS